MSHTNVRVIQWNLLSPALADPKSFPKCNPDALDPEYRWNSIKTTIEHQIMISSVGAGGIMFPVFCLQEICQTWLGRLITLFEKHNYGFVHRLYGVPFNNYMGVGIAWPRNYYQLTDSKIVRVADVIPPSSTVVATGYMEYMMKYAKKSTSNLLNKIGLGSWYKNPDIVDQWDAARQKWNAMIMICLVRRDLYDPNNVRDSTNEFVVATYHMPCDFTRPTVMTLHSYYALLTAQEWMNKQSNPNAIIRGLIFAGDFNIQPNSNPYKLIVEGTVPTLQSVEDGGLTANKDWFRDTFQPMLSAYRVRNQHEPRYTNYAHSSRSENPFEATIDYIFVDDDNTWTITDVLELPNEPGAEVFDTPLPTMDEPSDHLMIEASMHRIDIVNFEVIN